MYVVNGSDGRCLIAVRLIVGVRYLERPLREVLLYMVVLFNGNGIVLYCIVPYNNTGVGNWRYGAQCSSSLYFDAPGHVIPAPSCKLRSHRVCALPFSYERPRDIAFKITSALS